MLGVHHKRFPNNNKNLFITKQIEELTKSVKLDIEVEDTDMYVKLLPILNMLPNRCVNIEKESSGWYMVVWTKNNHIVEYKFLGVMLDYVITYDVRINMIEGTFTHGARNKENNPQLHFDLDVYCNSFGYETGLSGFVLDTFLNTIHTMVFVELSKEKVRLVDIKPNEKHGNILKGTQIKNHTDITITKVDSLWNVKSISFGEFKVSGHFRLQRCGVGFSDVKLIYIDEFVKTQYIRKSKKEMTLN